MEQMILETVNREWTSPAWDRVMAVASSWDLWWPLLVILVPFLIWRGGFRGRAALLCCGVCIFFVDALTVNTLKKLVGRPRPSAAQDGVRVVDLEKARPRILAVAQPAAVRLPGARINPQRGGSFPSGHTANNFCVAAVLLVFYRRWGWLAFFPAAFVSYSRIYVGSHWPSDVAVSIFLSIGVTLAVLVLLDILYEKAAPRLSPALAVRHPRLWSAVPAP
jgi:undecaprenyl-diphosphatase